jgi:hypothetical protein
MSQIAEEIEVYVDDSIKTKASRFFDCSLTTILHELLQNSRRAGATRVSILHGPLKDCGPSSEAMCQITVVDNGSGIADPKYVLGFGAGEFTKKLSKEEDPAGAGTFSLSVCGANVRSKDWQMHVSPDAFAGKAKAKVEYEQEPIEGTVITFPFKQSEVGKILGTPSKFLDCFPIELNINDHQVPVYKSYCHWAYDKFIRDDKDKDFKIVEYKPGVFIGLSCSETRHTGFWSSSNHGKLNTTWFNGLHVIGGINYSMSNYVTCCVSVGSLNGLEFTLPDRRGFIENKALEELNDFIAYEAAKYFCELKGRNHELPYLVYSSLKAMGFELDEAVPSYHREHFALTDDSGGEPLEWPWAIDLTGSSMASDTDPAKLIRLDSGFEQNDAMNVIIALEAEGLSRFDLIKNESRNQGYSWFDKLPLITEIRYKAKDNKTGKWVDLLDTGYRDADLDMTTSTIYLEFDKPWELEGKTSKVHTMRLPFVNLNDSPYNEIENYLLDEEYYKTEEYGASYIADMLVACFFYHSYEWESDGTTHEDSVNYIYREARAEADCIVGKCHKEVEANRWLERFNDEGMGYCPGASVVTLDFNERKATFKFQDDTTYESKL